MNIRERIGHQEPHRSLSKPYPRSVLTKEEAVRIFQLRQVPSGCDPARVIKASAVAKKYNVSPKTVRDIWNRRTWTVETRHLWTSDQSCNRQPPRKIGPSSKLGSNAAADQAIHQSNPAATFHPRAVSSEFVAGSFGFHANPNIFKAHAPLTKAAHTGFAAEPFFSEARNIFPAFPPVPAQTEPAFEHRNLIAVAPSAGLQFARSYLLDLISLQGSIQFVPLWPIPPLHAVGIRVDSFYPKGLVGLPI
jgi:hypothetical protein